MVKEEEQQKGNDYGLGKYEGKGEGRGGIMGEKVEVEKYRKRLMSLGKPRGNSRQKMRSVSVARK